MPFSRRWRIDSRAKLASILQALSGWSVNFERYPFELIFREERVEKTPTQRNGFHAACHDLAALMHTNPEEIKRRVKESFYGAEVRIASNRLEDDEVLEFARLLKKVGPYEVIVQSTEDSDREEYGRLWDYVYIYAAEAGISLPDRRTR